MGGVQDERKLRPGGLEGAGRQDAEDAMRTCDEADDDARSPAPPRGNARKSSPRQALARKHAWLWGPSEGWVCDLPPRQQKLKHCLLWTRPLY